MKCRLFGATMMLSAALSGAAAQQVQPDPLVKLGENRPRVQALIDSARAEGLPWEKIRLKALEGIRKGASSKDVVAAVRKYFKTLEQSRNALGPLATPDQIETGASVLDAGVSVDALAAFRVTSETRSPTRPLTYLADLVDRQNVPRTDAIEAFTKLWKDGAADSDFDGLWRLVDQDILSGVNPRAALQSRMRSLPPRKPPADQDTENPRS
jgi:hypothetical protein